MDLVHDYEKISSWIMNNFFLSDWERTWLEARFHLSDDDLPTWRNILSKYKITSNLDLHEYNNL